MAEAAHWLQRGCSTLPADARRIGPRCGAGSQVGGVRCCGDGRASCVSVCLGAQSCGGDDGQAANLSQATAFCRRRGLRLCTRAELSHGTCCRSGCAMDGMLVWTADGCDAAEALVETQLPEPRPRGARGLSHAAHCLGMARNHSLQYPVDADEHFREVQRKMEPFSRGVPPHSYAGYSGPWLENRWSAHFEAEYERVRARGGRLRDVFGPWVPIFLPWTDVFVKPGWRPRMFAALRSVLRPTVAYLTLVQMDEGLESRDQGASSARLDYAQLPNLLVLSAGGYGHVAVPLLKQPEDAAPPPLSARSTLASFVGTLQHGGTKIPRDLRRRAVCAARAAASRLGATVEACRGSGCAAPWRDVMRRSRASLAPRGYGRTSFHLSEIIQMGLLPIYLHLANDPPWLPYPSVFERFGFVADETTLPEVLRRLNAMGEVEFDARTRAVLEARTSHFSYGGTLEQIDRFLKGDPSRPTDLRCVPLPLTPSGH
tara:strand:- start:37 stop:1494 length:1458 start_codon:yes stop_codon:yes gene_type:complete